MVEFCCHPPNLGIFHKWCHPKSWGFINLSLVLIFFLWCAKKSWPLPSLKAMTPFMDGPFGIEHQPSLMNLCNLFSYNWDMGSDNKIPGLKNSNWPHQPIDGQMEIFCSDSFRCSELMWHSSKSLLAFNAKNTNWNSFRSIMEF